MENKEQENNSHLYISYWGEKIRQSRLGIGNSNFDLMNFMKSEVEKMLRFPRLPIFYIFKYVIQDKNLFGRLLDNNIQNNARKVQAIIKEHQISQTRVIRHWRTGYLKNLTTVPNIVGGLKPIKAFCFSAIAKKE